jgi:hypothetical protein
MSAGISLRRPATAASQNSATRRPATAATIWGKTLGKLRRRSPVGAATKTHRLSPSRRSSSLRTATRRRGATKIATSAKT